MASDTVLLPAARVGRRFYLIMSLVLATIVVFGFSHTVPSDFQPPGLPVLLQFHALVFASWVLLFVAQPALVFRGSVALHRKLGWLGAALAAVMLGLGTAAIMFALWGHSLPFFYPPGLFLVRGFSGLAVFGGLVTAGVWRRRRPEWHKRLLLCASISVIVPGLERAMPVPVFGTIWPFVVDGVVDAIALAGPVVDRLTIGRVHPAYVWGVGAIVAGQVLTDVVWPSPLAAVLLHAVGAG